MSANQELPVTGAPAAAVGLIGAMILGLGALLVTVSQWGAKVRRQIG